MEKNLWGNLGDLESTVTYPKDILEEQAEYLNESLGGLVKCRVVRKSLSADQILFCLKHGVTSDFSFSVKILSDYVEHYEYEICSLIYSIKIYPMAVSFDAGIEEELRELFAVENKNMIIAHDEGEFLDIIQRILSSKEVHQVLSGLISIAKKEKNLLENYVF